MSLLSFFKRAKPPLAEATGTALQMLGGILPGGGYHTPPTREMPGLLKAYTDHPWLYACATKAGEARAAQPWKLFVATNQGKPKEIRHDRNAQKLPFEQRTKYLQKLANEDGLREIEQHPLIDALDAPCSVYFSGQQRKVLTSVNLDLVGECFLLKERNGAGMPVNFWPIPSTWILALPSPNNPSYRVSFRGWQGDIPQSEILRMSKVNPINPYERGTSLANAQGDELDTYEYATRYEKHALFNYNMPTAIVTGKGISKENTERLEEKWNQKQQGFWNRAKAFFVSGEVMVQVIEHDFRKLQLTDLKKADRDTIIQTFGFPPEAFGIHEHSNRATATEWQNIMARGVTQPGLEIQRGYLQNDLVPDYDPRLIIDYVSPIEDDKAFHLQTIKDAPWLLDVSKQRALLNLPDNGDGKGVYVMSTLMRTRTLDTADNAQGSAPQLGQQDHTQV